MPTARVCVLWGTRVIFPPSLQEKVLQELHDTRPGISRMKSVARSYVWWPNLDSLIENTVSSCSTCQSMRSDPPTATVTALRDIFSRHGLPEIIVSDNGPQFKATELQQFCSSGGILHRTSAPYNPSTNGQAERVVQILKSLITNGDITAVIANYLLVYRTTPDSMTGEPPSMLLMGRRLRTRLDLLTRSVENYVENRQYSTILRCTARRGFRQFNVGVTVLARNYGKGGKWVHCVVSEVNGSRHYIVNVSGNLWK